MNIKKVVTSSIKYIIRLLALSYLFRICMAFIHSNEYWYLALSCSVLTLSIISMIKEK